MNLAVNVLPDSRRARWASGVAHWAYLLGLARSTTWGMSGGRVSVAVRWFGKPVYVLGWPVWKWRCVLRFHHWPTPYQVGLGFCGKCCPWPCCGAITREHAAGCPDDESRAA